MGDTCEIHHFLHRTFGQHREAGLTHGHHILMVAEDAERMRSDRTSRYVENRGEKLAGDFVHVGDHQQQTLRSRVGGCQRTGLERTVNSACRTAFRLHFLNEDRFAEDVFTPGSSPFVDIFRHSRRRSDGIDRSYFREHIAHVGSGLIAITSQEFLFFAHNCCY